MSVGIFFFGFLLASFYLQPYEPIYSFLFILLCNYYSLPILLSQQGQIDFKHLVGLYVFVLVRLNSLHNKGCYLNNFVIAYHIWIIQHIYVIFLKSQRMYSQSHIPVHSVDVCSCLFILSGLKPRPSALSVDVCSCLIILLHPAASSVDVRSCLVIVNGPKLRRSASRDLYFDQNFGSIFCSSQSACSGSFKNSKSFILNPISQWSSARMSLRLSFEVSSLLSLFGRDLKGVNGNRFSFFRIMEGNGSRIRLLYI